jgi:DNA polymerase-4
MRNKNWQTTTVSIKLRYSDFTTITRAKTIHPTSDDGIIFDVARQLFLDNYEKNRKVRLIGVHLTNFQEAEEQEELFETTNVKRKKMFQAVDSIRSKYGFKSLHVGDI